MSDNKRNRKNNQNKELKRPIILAKKADRDDKSVLTRDRDDKPRILLKPKDSSEQCRNTPPVQQISIAARPVDPSTSNADVTKANRSQSSATPTTSKESHTSTGSAETVLAAATAVNVLQSMKKPISIVSDHYQIQTHCQDFLIETNTDFFVVGVVGTQGAGKSFIANLLVDDTVDMNDDIQVHKLLNGQIGAFKMRHKMKESLSNMCCTEGIQMYVTQHRTILLDCSPLLCNPYKKEAILNELDDLKMVNFLLSVCNTLIVVEDGGLNLHLMRLLILADSMKIDVYENGDHIERRHSANILLFKNKCQNHQLLAKAKERRNNMYRAYFEWSILNSARDTNDQEKKTIFNGQHELDIYHFPLIQENDKNHYQAHPDLGIMIAALRQRVFMTPRTPFPAPNQQTIAFTEKCWFHFALSVWESHKTSYFLRKYESLKEKEWALRV